MVSLSQFFPNEAITDNLAKYLKAGAVVRLFCAFTTPPKYKFLMIATVEPLRVFIINSEIYPFILNRPELLADQVDIPSQDHLFLTHDSVLNCIEAHRAFEIDDLKNELITNFSEVYKGELKPYVLDNVLEVVEKSQNLSRIIKTQIIQAINQARG